MVGRRAAEARAARSGQRGQDEAVDEEPPVPEERPATAGAPPVPDRRANAGVYDLRRLRVLRARRRLAWSWDRTASYAYRPRRLRQPVRSVAAAGVVAFDRIVLARLLGNDAPNLRADHRARLNTIYAPDLDLLTSLIGRDLTAWDGRTVSR